MAQTRNVERRGDENRLSMLLSSSSLYLHFGDITECVVGWVGESRPVTLYRLNELLK